MTTVVTVSNSPGRETLGMRSQNYDLDFTADKMEKKWVDSVVNVVSTCNKVLVRNCDMCQSVYIDKQVQYECEQEQLHSEAPGSPMGRVLQKMESSFEVELYRQFLFDESAVAVNLDMRKDQSEGNDERSMSSSQT